MPTTDSDCTVVLDDCFGPDFCAAYVTKANGATALAALEDAHTACTATNTCARVICSAPRPAACVTGVCSYMR